MNKIMDFYQLDAWKKNHHLTLTIYKASKKFPKDEKFGLISQLRRAASSVTANIAEGFGRYHYNDKVRFYLQARGSLKEVQNFIYLAQDLNYLTKSSAKNIWEQSKDCEKLINGLIKSIKKQK